MLTQPRRLKKSHLKSCQRGEILHLSCGFCPIILSLFLSLPGSEVRKPCKFFLTSQVQQNSDVFRCNKDTSFAVLPTQPTRVECKMEAQYKYTLCTRLCPHSAPYRMQVRTCQPNLAQILLKKFQSLVGIC